MSVQPRTFRRVFPDAGEVTAAELAADYRRRPGLRANMIASVDGGATLSGVSAGLGSPGDQAHMDLLRRVADVVLVGSGTLRDEGYGPLRVSEDSVAWRRDHGLSDHPVLVVVSARLSVAPDAPFLASSPGAPRPVVLSVAPDAFSARFRALDSWADERRERAERRAALEEVADVVEVEDYAQGLAVLRSRGWEHQLSEGGPSVLARFVAEDLVDEQCMTIAPTLLGAGAQRIVAGRAGAQAPGMQAGQDEQAEERSLRLRHLLVDGSHVLGCWERAR